MDKNEFAKGAVSLMLKDKRTVLMLILSAVTTGAAVTFSKYLGFIGWASMIPMISVIVALSENKAVRAREVFAAGLIYFECFYAVCYHWFFYLHPLDFTGITGFASILTCTLACFGLALLQAIGGGLFFLATVFALRTETVKRLPALKLFVPASLYSFLEFTQTLGSCGVPWARLAIGQTDYIIPAQIASVLGSYGVTFVIVLINTLLALAIIAEKRNTARVYALSALAIFFVNMLLGTLIFCRTEKRISDADTVTVALIQGNYDSSDKWIASPPQILEKYLHYTELAASEGAELIIWPETALPFIISEGTVSSNRIAIAARDLNVTVLVGTITSDGENDYNSVMCYLPDGSICDTVYNKRHLVPFGEFVPMQGLVDTLLPFLSDISIASDPMVPGNDTGIFNTPKYSMGSIICFDSIYEESVRQTVKDGGSLICLSTNDSWFRDSLAVYMHTNHARLRAIENGRFVARSANTGLSAVISPSGTVSEALPLMEEGYLIGELAPLTHVTLYTSIGFIFIYILGFFSVIPFLCDSLLIIKNRSIAPKCKQSL